MMFKYVYVLRSESNGYLYIGKTSDLKRRYIEHQKGISGFTKKFAPWKLIYYEAHTDAKDAARREGYLKTTLGNRALKRMLRNRLNRRSTT